MDSLPWFSFTLKTSSSFSSAKRELLALGLEDLALLQEKGKRQIIGRGDPSCFPPVWRHIESFLSLPSSIDWVKQWELFCPYFDGTLCKIPLGEFYPEKPETLLLHPGPGFGDLSHPTTHLMLKLLGPHAEEKTVIDLGCGSGILALSALKWGAKKAYGLDIDEEALTHTEKNARLNGLEVDFLPPPPSDLLCLNMTFQEQKEALRTLSSYPPLWLTSGILAKQQEDYLSFLHTFSLSVERVEQEGEWLAFQLRKTL